jgi:hypothetical protein
MFQEILALATVAGAIFFAIRGLHRAVTPDPKESNSFCSGCATGSCAAKQLKVSK